MGRIPSSIDSDSNVLAALSETLLRLSGDKHYSILLPPENVELCDERCQHETPQLAFLAVSQYSGIAERLV